MGCSLSGLGALYQAVSTKIEDFSINGRSFETIRVVGEGGYAFVYMVKELHHGRSIPGITESDIAKDRYSQNGHYAIKKVIIQTDEQHSLVKTEIENCLRFNHPNLLPLLDHSIVEAKSESGIVVREALLLFPLYEQGTVMDYFLSSIQKDKQVKQRFGTIAVLEIFHQICTGLQHMHNSEPPYSHNDIKPGNVLLREHSGVYQAVIMDFGSASPARRQIKSRSDALSLQEWAAQHCTAPYRTPEFWDCPSFANIDEKSDIWSLGCTLFALMYGESPFEYSLGGNGGSLQLAIMNAQIKFPSTTSYPVALHQLVTWMVNPTPSARPSINDIILHIGRVKAKIAPSHEGIEL